MADITPARKLFDLLVSKDFDPELLDNSGKPAPNPAEADIFSFDFRAQSGKDYGTVVIMLSNEGDLEVYCADNVGKTMDEPDKTEWFQFLEQLKNFAVRTNRMNFGVKNLNHLRYSMQGQAAIKEGLFESWTGKKDVSYNDGPNQARLMIKHKRSLGEGEARFRYIESLFIETADSERYRLPFNNLTAGKAMLEHVRNGGKPYDMRGQHIAEMVSDLNVLSRFRRANHGKLLEGDTAQLVEQTNAYYETLKTNLKSLTGHRGYNTYFESWSPLEVNEESVVIEGLKHLFVTQSIDQRIEDALPLIARIQQQENAMKEANIFEAWAERLVEGTWQTPDTPEKQAQLVELMSTDLPVGADATNVTEQLYDLIGDDELFDQLHALAERDANADARQVILDRMQELSNDPDIRKVIEQLNIDATAEMNPPEATNPADLEPMNESRLMDAAGETIDHILNRFKHEVKKFEQQGELDDDLYHALFDYWNDAGEIPYGTQKARDGDPYEWVAQNLQSHLSGGGIVGGNPDEDYGIERESVMHGDYAEEKNAMRRLAGLPPEETDEGIIGGLAGGAGGAALGGSLFGLPGAIGGGLLGAMAGDSITDEAEETDEGVLGTVGGAMGGGMLGTLAGGAIGGALGGPAGAVLGATAGQGIGTAAGAVGGQELTKGGSGIIEAGEEETDEGWKGQLAGGTVGTLAGGALGAVGGPIGSMIGGALGGTAGQMIGDKLGGNEETDEGKLGAVAGGALGGAATRSVKGAVAGAKLGSAIQDRFAKKEKTNEDDASLFDDATCNMTEAGENCSVHGMEECWGSDDSSPLAGQYGHSGKLKAVDKNLSFLDRLKELSGLKRD